MSMIVGAGLSTAFPAAMVLLVPLFLCFSGGSGGKRGGSPERL
jgi:hypothetical protein